MATVKGILGRKLGMTQIWDAENRIVPVTVIQAGPCRVVQLKTPERDGYSAVQLALRRDQGVAAHQARARATSKKAAADAGRSTSPSCASTTCRCTRSARSSTPTCSPPASSSTSRASARARASPARCSATTSRARARATATTRSTGRPGSIGACATPARVFKGVRMAGQYGNKRITTLNLEVVEGDAERGLLLVRGRSRARPEGSCSSATR